MYIYMLKMDSIPITLRNPILHSVSARSIAILMMTRSLPSMWRPPHRCWPPNGAPLGAQVEQCLVAPGSFWIAQQPFWNNLYRMVQPTRWAPTSYKWSYNPYKWPYNWVTGAITPISGLITILITGRGPTLYCKTPCFLYRMGISKTPS